MSLAPGTRLGVYEITGQIGAGGMGEVYRATDSNLKRSVAIKVLPASVAGDADRLARFQREAEVLAALNHPNIAAIYGLEKTQDFTALVMELVEGEDLSQRIARGAIPLDEALPIAKQIAEALEAAHEQSIIHRDLKPANIKLRADGTVKVLDFGLAKALGADAASAAAGSLSMSPTITTPAMTRAGMILGTAAYMSPEQARGKWVDKRADIWAFGAVLYEMLTAQRAFRGEDLADTLAAVVKLDPAWDAVGADVPPRVRQVLRVCLQKDPRQRAQAIGDVRLALEGAFETPAPQSATAAGSSAPGGRLAWMMAFAVAAVGVIVLAVPTWRHLRETTPPETRTEIVTPATGEPTSFALSPDGRQIVFVASSENGSRLWLRSLATSTAQPLTGTDGATYPFWAPDGRSIGFFADSALKRLDVEGASVRILAPATNGSGGTWNADGVIVFSPTNTTPLQRVPAAGGTASAVTSFGPQHAGHIGPHFLPDGLRFLFYVFGASETSGIYLGGLDGRVPIRLAASDGAGVFLPSEPGGEENGWVLLLRDGALVGQRLDLTKTALVGEPQPLADSIADRRLLTVASVSAATRLVAFRIGRGSLRRLTWVDRSGMVQGTVGDSDNTLQNPRVSPDGRRVLVTRTVQGNNDAWLLDGTRTSRVTFDTTREDFPVWSGDGTRIVFRSNRRDQFDLYQKLASGAGSEEQIVASAQLKSPSHVSADGRFFMYNSIDPQSNSDLWVLPMDIRTPSVFLKTPFREVWGVFSPDSRWVAYQSNESGRPEIYVRPFVPPSRDASADKPAGATGADRSARSQPDQTGGQWQVSTAGGIMPAWRPDGKELFYLNPAGVMMAAPIVATASTIEPGAPVALFPTHIFGGGVDAQVGRQYDVAPDGRFLINLELDSAVAPITLLQNWDPAAKK